ncbi:hypothetical protein BTUL_0006g00720 [Botrytis tulipae]|uniref:Uncharacterized protein n=1 Tax=Botrytis tulipae TaxID=87230 RepID=A0A4Z1F6Q7_9HELO|nr:hypothetical protein BTUL_0006g00720 [Botrytis tulipae]
MSEHIVDHSVTLHDISLLTRGVLVTVISTLATITKQAADTINGKPYSTLSKSKLNAKV